MSTIHKKVYKVKMKVFLHHHFPFSLEITPMLMVLNCFVYIPPEFFSMHV